MAEIEVPFTDSELDSSDPAGSAMTLVTIVLGMVAFMVGSHYAQGIANRVVAVAPDVDDDDNKIEVV